MITDTAHPSTTVAILGAGPAGMSCANACLSFGLTPIVIERGDHAGGAQRTNFHPNLWMLGAPGETGETMTRRMAEHYAGLGVDTRYRSEIERVAREGSGFLITLKRADGTLETLHVATIVLATGMRPRATPELEQLARTSQRVIIGPLSDTIRDGIRNDRVLILGGGDNALDHALFLAERNNRILVCARGRFSARAAFITHCSEQPEIELHDECRPTVSNHPSGKIRAQWPSVTRDFDWLLVMFGYIPNVDPLERFEPGLRPRLTSSLHVIVDNWQRTSVAGIYAAGDITDCLQPSVPTAIAQGLAAARSIERQWHHLPS